MPDLRRLGRHAFQLTKRAVEKFFEDGCPQRAAAISYYALFSLFPLAILAVAGLGLVVDDAAARERVIQTVLDQLPLQEGQGRREIDSLLQEVTDQGGAFSVVGGLGLLFAASGVMGAIRHALNAAWNVDEPRAPVTGKLLDMVLVLGFGILVAASFVLTLAVRLTDAITDHLGDIGAVLDAVVQQGVRLLPAVLALVTFAVLFRVVPASRPGWRDSWPGVLVAAGGYEVAKAGFSFYLENFARYGTVYASLGTAVAFMAFIFVAANVALLGAEAASEWPSVRDGEIDEQEDDEPDEPLRERIRRVLRGLFVRPGRTASGAGPGAARPANRDAPRAAAADAPTPPARDP